MFPWGDNRRFNSYSSYFTREFGSRVQKISIDAGFSCPNRDGKISTGGCTFCRNDAFNPSYCRPEKSVRQQIEEGIGFHQRRYRRAKSYLAYFQAFSNTYKPINELEKIYREALSVEGVVGIVIGTRPDCLNEEILEMLNGLSTTIILELGIESVYDTTLKRVNRGHTFACVKNAIEIVHKYGFHCGGHFIFGLPGETRDMMLNAADIISELPLTTVKFHQLQIFKDTKMADEYLAKVGIRPGSMKFTFNVEEHSFTVQVGSLTIPGTYKVGNGERTVNLTFGKSMQFLSMTGTLESTLSGARMLFTADKAMTFLKKVASLAGQSSSEVAGIAKLAEGYDNYRIGFKLSK